jgi:hypothetical protein
LMLDTGYSILDSRRQIWRIKWKLRIFSDE